MYNNKDTMVALFAQVFTLKWYLAELQLIQTDRKYFNRSHGISYLINADRNELFYAILEFIPSCYV
jgi:hypothetical protein